MEAKRNNIQMRVWPKHFFDNALLTNPGYFKYIHSTFCVVLFFLLQTSTLWSLTYDYRQNRKTTILKFNSETPLSATLLQPSAKSSRIFLKISGLESTSLRDLYSAWHAPDRSAVAGIRIIPYNKNALLVIDLIADVEFKFVNNEAQFEIHLNDGIFRDPVENQYLRGVYWQRLGDSEKALKLYRSVVKQRRSHPYAYFKAGQIRLKMGDYRKAEFNLKRALKNGCDSLGVYRSLAALYRIYGNSRLTKQYEDEYQKWTSSPSHPRDFKENNARQNVAFVNSSPENKVQSKESDGNEVAAKGKKISVIQLLSNIKWLVWGGGLGVLFLFIIIRITLQFAKQKRLLRENTPAAVAVQENKQRLRARKKPLLRVEGQDIQRTNHETPIAVQKQPAKEHSPHIAVQPQQAQSQVENSDHKQTDHFEYISQKKNPQVEELIDTLLQKNSGNIREAENSPDFQSLEGLLMEDDLNPGESDKARQLAQNYNLGVGEVELALKLSTIRHKTHREKDVRQQILNLKNQNLSIDEIARQAKLGKGEVELFLKFAETFNAPKK